MCSCTLNFLACDHLVAAPATIWWRRRRPFGHSFAQQNSHRNCMTIWCTHKLNIAQTYDTHSIENNIILRIFIHNSLPAIKPQLEAVHTSVFIRNLIRFIQNNHTYKQYISFHQKCHQVHSASCSSRYFDILQVLAHRHPIASRVHLFLLCLFL